MGFFGSVWKGLTGPIRGVVNLIQGKVWKAVGAFGDTAKLAAPILGATGVGAPLAMGLGAAGGAASRWGEGESNLLKIAGSAAGGAAAGAAGAGAGKLFQGPLKGIGSKILGRAAAPLTEEGMAAATMSAPGVAGAGGAEAATPG